MKLIIFYLNFLIAYVALNFSETREKRVKVLAC
jgi:hypothetical protein